jgi:hypothetical protein
VWERAFHRAGWARPHGSEVNPIPPKVTNNPFINPK